MKKNAFTLIEIVIVIAIIGIMALVSVPAFNQYEKSNQFDTKVEEITALFNRAYALSQTPVRAKKGTKELTCDRVEVQFDGAEFRIVLKNNSAGVITECGSSTSSIIEKVKINESGSLPMQVTGLSLDPVTGLAVWTFTADKVYMPVNPTTSFVLETVTGSEWQKQVAFNLSSDKNNFSIKNGQ